MIKTNKIIEHSLFSIIGKSSDELKMKTFVVGGWVRDCLLKRNKENIEFDIVCDGDGIKLAKKVAHKLNIKKINIYQNFGTAAFKYKEVNVEFIGARNKKLLQI